MNIRARRHVIRYVVTALAVMALLPVFSIFRSTA
jgi:hypothetical protein